MSYTPEEITEILEAYFESIAHRQYIGSRYVPIFGRVGESSCDWDNTGDYEPLTIVLYQGNSYTSRQFVPAGADISNTDYWVLTGNFNAQVEQYRIRTAALENALPIADFDSTNTVKKYVDDAIDNIDLSAIENIIPASSFDSTNTVKKYVDDAVSGINDGLIDFDTSAGNIIYKIEDTDATLLFTVDDLPEGFYAQGFATDGTNFYVGATDGTNGYVGKYAADGTRSAYVQDAGLKHANGICIYNNMLYVATIQNGIVVIDPSTMTIDSTVNITGYAPVGVGIYKVTFSQSGISGDMVFICMLTDNGNLISISDGVLNKLSTVPQNIHTQQGMCIYKNLVVLPRSVNYYAAGNILDFFDLFGNRMFSVLLPMIGELEDVDIISANERQAFINVSGSIYRINLEHVIPTYITNTSEMLLNTEMVYKVETTTLSDNTSLIETFTLPVPASIGIYNSQIMEFNWASSNGYVNVCRKDGLAYYVQCFNSGSGFVQFENLIYTGQLSSGKYTFTLDTANSTITRISTNGTVTQTSVADSPTSHIGTHKVNRVRCNCARFATDYNFVI